MPTTGQIVPAYLHPHVETFINDNTIFEEVVSPAPDGVRLISVFTSSKGRDGVILPFDTTTKYIDEYGNPNYKLFGQPGYMPYAALSTGQAKAWCMRIMPADANYANVVVVAKVKVDILTDPENPQLNIRHEAVFVPALNDKEDFSTLVDAMLDEVADTDGFKTYPLFGINVLGRGVYGNNLRIRMGSSLQADKDNNYKNFKLEILDSEGGVKIKESFTGSFYPEAILGSQTLYLSDIVNDSQIGSTKIGFYVCEISFSKIFETYKTEVDEDTIITPGTFDIITGLDMLGVAVPTIKFITDDDTIALDNVEGVLMSGGTDGSFTFDPDTIAEREAAIETAYVSAFEGTIDAAILSKRRTPADLIFDANYPEEVKRALIALLIKRYDAYGYIDGGILNTVTNATDWAETFSTLGDRIFSKDCQHYYIKDQFSGKNIPMTITYFYASQLPIHFKNVGNQVPFAGETFARLTGGIRGSLKPVIDADDLDTKEILYNKKVNYFECIAENTFIRGTQGTSQLVWSDLSEENNMHVLLEMKRILEGMVASKSYKFAEAEDRKKFTEAAERVFSDYRGNKCRDVAVYFDMNTWEEERSILHCYLSVIFRTMSKRGIIEIDINKRV